MPKKRREKKKRKTLKAPVPALSTRAETEPDFFTRAVTIALRADGKPMTLNETDRSIEVVGATENPVLEYDYELGRILPVVLLMSGLEIPEAQQIPLLDTHGRCATASILGSYRELAVVDTELHGRVVFSGTEEAQAPYQKVREGHLTDFSIGRHSLESIFIPDGQTQVVEGRSYEGPIKIVTKWQARELSACPIGADPAAKARSAPAKTSTKTEGEEKKMDERTRKYLETRGLAKDATEDEAWAFLEGLDVRTEPAAPGDSGTHAPAVQAVDEDTVRAEAVKAEQSRIMEIRGLCARGDASELADGFIRDNTSVDDARRTIFERVTAESFTKDRPGYRPPVEITQDERDKVRAAMTDSLVIRSGGAIETPAPGARDLAGFTLVELARESLRRANQPIHGAGLEMVGRALTTSDLPSILAATANKSLLEGYEAASETWPVWCAVGSVSDFKDHTSNRISEAADLDEIPEHGEYKHGSLSDAKETYQVVTYGKLLSISRQAIINDDLNAITGVPRQHGESASRKVGDVAYAVLTANAAMGDGTALFAAGHSNLGAAGALSETTMAEMIKLMKLQKDIGGKRRLNIRPMFYLAPVALEGSAEIFFNSGQFAGANEAATRVNPYAGSRFTRVFEPRLDDDSSTAWYLAGPKGKTVTVFFLGGNQSPYMETRQGWNVDGVEYKVRIDAGAKALDWRALAKNAGA